MPLSILHTLLRLVRSRSPHRNLHTPPLLRRLPHPDGRHYHQHPRLQLLPRGDLLFVLASVR